ncbi:peroxisomal membrane protein PEX14 [Caerostris extrusa]|uniref:Peroxisomal membrane protein PEX14 n=1 Tax=Caerostris extrusa TaxID=172846 RepID=A0AAV4XUC2_CAEEX|nr:peroxisomal membrane protein PEX14 [Caerostris extrusa]
MSDNSESDTTQNVKNTSIRRNLVNTAVNFLLNEEVKSRSESSKIAFMKRKGLNDSEIAKAFEMAKSDSRYYSVQSQNNQLSNTYPLPPYQRPYSIWFQLRRFSSSFIILAAAFYGLHQFYKLFIEPWLFGTKTEKEEIIILKGQLMELTNSISQLKDAVVTLESSVRSQVQQVERIFLAENTAYMPVPIAIAELKSDVASVKSLLINRHQFPALPKVSSPSIPHWQRESSKKELKEKAENSEEDEFVTVENEAKNMKKMEDLNVEQNSELAIENKDENLIVLTSDTESDSAHVDISKSATTVNGAGSNINEK